MTSSSAAQGVERVTRGKQGNLTKALGCSLKDHGMFSLYGNDRTRRTRVQAPLKPEPARCSFVIPCPCEEFSIRGVALPAPCPPNRVFNKVRAGYLRNPSSAFTGGRFQNIPSRGLRSPSSPFSDEQVFSAYRIIPPGITTHIC